MADIHANAWQRPAPIDSSSPVYGRLVDRDHLRVVVGPSLWVSRPK